MTAQQLYKVWCERMNTTTNSMIQCQQQGTVSQEYLDGFVEAVKTSMNTAEVIITEQQ